MPPRIQKETVKRRPHFLKEWRQFRNLSLNSLAERLGSSAPSLSRIENGKQPYTQDVLEGLAEVLQCHPADLISRSPTEHDTLWAIWDGASSDQKVAIEAMVRAVLDVTGKRS